MAYYIIKTVITVIIVVVASEVAKRSSLVGAIIISLPLTSLLAFTWLYWDTRDSEKIINLSYNTLIMVIPSFIFFISLPIMLRLKITFSISLIISLFLTSISYFLFIYLIKKYGYSI